MVKHVGYLQKLWNFRSGIWSYLFFLSNNNRQLQVVLDGKSSQEYPTNAVLPQGSILDPKPLLLYINDLHDDGMCGAAIYADDITSYSKYDQASDLWQQLELVYELESDLCETVDWDRKWLVDFNAERLSWFHLISLITLVLLM